MIDEDDFYTPDEFEQFIQCFPRNKENGEYVCYVIVNLLYLYGMSIWRMCCTNNERY